MTSVVIEDLDDKGRGEGRFGPCYVQVHKVLPGETVEVYLGKARKQLYKAALEGITHPSPERVEPRCKHQAICGGCAFQQMDYAAQLRWKQAKVEKLFGPLVGQILPSDPWHYRNKMEFSFGQDEAGRRFLGLLMPGGGGKVVDIHECHLVPRFFNELLQRVRHWWLQEGLDAYHHRRDQGHLRTLTLREGPLVMLTVSGHSDFQLSQEQQDRFAALFDKGTSVLLRVQKITKGTPTAFEEKLLAGELHVEQQLGKFRFRVSATSFFQPNRRQAERLYREAIAMASLKGDERVFDLYCGTGTLACFAAEHAKEVIGVELSEEAVADAKENAKLNALNHVQFLQGDVAEVVKKLPPPDVIFVDPPRAGLGMAGAILLNQMGTKKIIYISCNPYTQAQDLEVLTHYRLITCQPIDQAPHTPHIENIAQLEFYPSNS
ncbi:MAG: 23S rRNA (uracil(1939)-C(5))-methyltransferase RlmD [Verrucomicrobia bacterium]|nr:23S rRNA (uracil(1939)-C(5))-methyltransferase RlmD [Verrucomicrobiota bacterium]